MNSAQALFYRQSTYSAPHTGQSSQWPAVYMPVVHRPASIWSPNHTGTFWPSMAPMGPIAPMGSVAPVRVPNTAGMAGTVAPSVAPSLPVVQGPFPYAMPVYAPHLSHMTLASERVLPAVPEYDNAAMALFVAAMSQEAVFSPGRSQPALVWELRSCLAPLLSVTRLSCSTVMLGLVYLGQRFRRSFPSELVTSNGSLTGSVDLFKAYIVVALILANKINDDNTFTNASWAEASGIPTWRLCALEREWLAIIDWNLYLDASGTDQWSRWTHSWQFSAGAAAAHAAMSPHALSPQGSPTLGTDLTVAAC